MKLTEETPGVVQSTEESGISMVMSFLKEMFQPELMAGWASAAMTLLATGVALWLAYVARKIKVKGRCIGKIGFSVGYDAPPERVISVYVVNVGHRSVTITDITFRCERRLFARWRKKGKSVWFSPAAYVHGSSKLPVTLPDGGEAQWLYSQEVVKKFVKNLARTETDAKSLRCIISTSHGHIARATPDKHAIKMFIEAVRDKENSFDKHENSD